MPTTPTDVSQLSAKDVSKLKKAEVIEALDQLGLEAEKDAKVDELKAALEDALSERDAEAAKEASDAADEAKADDAQAEESDAAADDEPDEDDEPVGGDAKSVYNAQGTYIRTYTLQVHGKEYADLAKQFAGKIGGTVKDGAK